MTVGSSTIRLSGLTKRFGPLTVLDNIDITVAAGTFTAVLGPSGSGKSTLLMTIAGFQQPDAGGVFVDGVDISGQPPERRGIGVVFQGYALFPHMSVAGNIAYPLRARGLRKPVVEAKVREIARMMEIEDLLYRLPSQISGGQRQRVAIARALVFEPKLLLLDEPLSALDRNLRDRMKEELRRVHERLAVTVIMVTHDQDEATELAGQIIVMEKGRVIADGAPKALYDTPPNAAVAGFFGRANFLAVTRSDAETIEAGGAVLPRALVAGNGTRLLLRPEAFAYADVASADQSHLMVTVDATVFRSGRTTITGRLSTGEALVVELQSPVGKDLQRGETLHLRMSHGFLLD